MNPPCTSKVINERVFEMDMQATARCLPAGVVHIDAERMTTGTRIRDWYIPKG